MSGQGARSYPLVRGTHGPVRITVTGNIFHLYVHGTEVLSCNLYIGKLWVRPFMREAIASERAINRFFSLVGATRYELVRNGPLTFIKDVRKNTRTQINSTGLFIGLPVKSVFKLLSAHGHYSVHQAAVFMEQEYRRENETLHTISADF